MYNPMVEIQSDQGATPEIEWPRGIKREQLQSLLDENRKGEKLRSVVSGALRSESDYLSLTFGSSVSIEGFIGVTSDLNYSVEFVDSGKDTAVDRITNELFAQTGEIVTLDKLRLLEEKLDEYGQIVVPEVEIDQASDLPWRLAETMQRVKILRRDPRGFALVDYLAEPEQSAYPRGHSNFEPENLGRTEAAQRYKKLYNLLLANGATSD